MQEPVKRKSLFSTIVAVIVAVVVIAAIVVSYGIFNRSYNANLDKLKEMVATAQTQIAGGSDKAGATPKDEYDYYMALGSRIAGLPQILDKLNGKYPLLLGRGSNESLGISALQAKMDDMSPKLAVLKDCIAGDASIAAKLSDILGNGISAGRSSDYSDLIALNNSLHAKLAGIAFEGAMESSRAALAASVESRSKVLDYLMGDAAINEELATLSADGQTAPADLKTQFSALLGKNDELTAKADGIDLTGYGSGDGNLAQMIADRKNLINANIGYMGELATLQNSVAAFCADLGSGSSKEGKLSQKLASYMVWINELKDLQNQLGKINAKDQYKAIAAKRTIASLGMTPAGQTLLNYEKALNAVNSAMTGSIDMEKKIGSLLTEKKMDLPDKMTALDTLAHKNDAMIASLNVDVPDDLKAGLDSFIAGCTERSTFLEEFMGYVEDQQIASGCAATYHDYLSQRQANLNSAAYWETIEGPDGANVKYFKGLASDEMSLASQQKTMQNTANKNAAAHKKAYEASRKKYQPMLDT